MKPPPDQSQPADPLIDEVRSIRRAISDEHGNDVGRLCDHLRDVQRRYASRVVRRQSAASVGAVRTQGRRLSPSGPTSSPGG